MKNIAYIISDVEKSINFEWLISALDKTKFNLIVILISNNTTPFERFLQSISIKTYRINYKGKKSLPSAIFKTRQLLKKEKIEIVHAHLFLGSLIGILAGKIAGVKTRIHTRHNSTIHHDYHSSAVKYDRLINFYSTKIIAISPVVRDVLVNKENCPESKILLIPHGFLFNEFENVSNDRINLLLEKYKLKNTKGPIIGVVSRYIHWKGVQYIIPAFEEILKEHRTAHLVLANAHGPYQNEIKKMLQKLPDTTYTEIKFEEDSLALFHLFDLFIHVPIDRYSEAFGQVYIEATASKIPCIITKSGIADTDFIDGEHALIVDYKNEKSIVEAIKILLNDFELRHKLTHQAKLLVNSKFALSETVQKLEKLYNE